MIGKAADMVPKMIEGIQAALPALMDAGMTILTALVNGILQAPAGNNGGCPTDHYRDSEWDN